MPGFKLFRDNQILTSDIFMDHLANQSIIVCITDTDRDLGLASYAREGMVAYLKDVDEHSIYDGTSWVKIANHAEVISTYDPRDNLVINAMETIL
jgi:hypothetical protein